MPSSQNDARVDPSLFALGGFQEMMNGQYGYGSPQSIGSSGSGTTILADNIRTGSATKRRRVTDTSSGTAGSGKLARARPDMTPNYSSSSYTQASQRNARHDHTTIQQTRPYHYDQTSRMNDAHEYDHLRLNETENQATPKSDDDSDVESLEDHQLYETTGTPLPYPPNPHSSTSLIQPTYPIQQLAHTSIANGPTSSSSKPGKKPGRPALPPEIALERKRDRARLHAAETRRRKKEEESGEGRWFRDLEIEKAVLEERYRRLERDYEDLKAQVAGIPCISMLSPHLAKTVGARPESTSNGTGNPLLQIVLPLLLQTIDKGGEEVDVNALIGVLRGRSKDAGNLGRKRKRTSEVRFGGIGGLEGGAIWDGAPGEGDEGATSSDSAKSTPRPNRTRTRTKRRDEREERSLRREETRQGSMELDGTFGGNDLDLGSIAETPSRVNVTPPPQQQTEPRTQMSLRKRIKSTSNTLPEPIPATPIDSDEDDGDFVPESELDDAGPTPYTDQAISPGTTNNETPRLGDAEDEDDDDERFEYDPDDPDLYEPIVDVAVPDWLDTGGWLGQTLNAAPQQEAGQVNSAVVGNQERDELVARLRAEMGKSRAD